MIYNKLLKRDSALTPLLDVLFLMLILFGIIIALIKHNEQTTEVEVEKNAIYQIIMTWDGESSNDVDLWVRDPQKRTVGWNRREGGSGSLHSLAHDDLGSVNDVSNGEVIKENREVVNIRGCVEGEYIVNAHMYALRDPSDKRPCKVTAKLIRLKPYELVTTKEIEMVGYGDEMTFFRFTFDDKEKVIETGDLPARIANIAAF